MFYICLRVWHRAGAPGCWRCHGCWGNRCFFSWAQFELATIWCWGIFYIYFHFSTRYLVINWFVYDHKYIVIFYMYTLMYCWLYLVIKLNLLLANIFWVKSSICSQGITGCYIIVIIILLLWQSQELYWDPSLPKQRARYMCSTPCTIV